MTKHLNTFVTSPAGTIFLDHAYYGDNTSYFSTYRPTYHLLSLVMRGRPGFAVCRPTSIMQVDTTINDQVTHVLLSIAFSHYNEKARWAFAYYAVPYTHHLLLPALHMLSMHLIAASSGSRTKEGDPHSSPYSTPCLVLSDALSSNVRKIIPDSHDILVYLSDNFSNSEQRNLYTSCGLDKAERIRALEKHYDEVLGVAARCFAYYDMLVVNKWRSLLPFALVGFRNNVGTLQSSLWFLGSPLIGRILTSVMKCTKANCRDSIAICREEFERASELLEDSPYLAGNRLSAADITFAALAYPVLGIGHQEGFQQYPPGPNAFSSEGRALFEELRATKAGQHVLRLYKEERYFGSPLPQQKKTLLGMW